MLDEPVTFQQKTIVAIAVANHYLLGGIYPLRAYDLVPKVVRNFFYCLGIFFLIVTVEVILRGRGEEILELGRG